MVVNDVIFIQCGLTTGTLVSPADAFFDALVAETVSARRDGRPVHGGHAYGALEVLVNGGNRDL
jgi:hypothetical protein